MGVNVVNDYCFYIMPEIMCMAEVVKESWVEKGVSVTERVKGEEENGMWGNTVMRTFVTTTAKLLI